jgi:uncharacterized membrane protein
MVAAMRAGKKPNPLDGSRGKQRSVHNNYFTLPVVFIMISNHYAATYSHPEAWAVLALICAAGVLIRHFFNRRHKGAFAWQYLAAAAVLIGVVAVWTAPHIQALPPVEGPVTFDRVRSIVGQRCVTCHSQAPTFTGITQPPAGVDSDERGRDRAERAAHLPAGRRHADHAARQRHADHRRGARGDRGLGGGRRPSKLAPAALRD